MNPIPYPNITAQGQQEQLIQIRVYLYQLADRLNALLEQLEGGGHGENL